MTDTTTTSPAGGVTDEMVEAAAIPIWEAMRGTGDPTWEYVTANDHYEGEVDQTRDLTREVLEAALAAAPGAAADGLDAFAAWVDLETNYVSERAAMVVKGAVEDYRDAIKAATEGAK